MMHYFYGPGINYLSQGSFWWMGVVSMIIHAIVWIVLIYFAVKFINKYFQKANDSKVKEDSAMIILRERYARGEIDADEFARRKAALD